MENNVDLTKTISSRIYSLRGCDVMFDIDVASLYHVDTKMLKRAVRRNLKRFPLDFMFEPSDAELDFLRKQLRGVPLPCDTPVTGRNIYPPFVFTELGIAMLSGVLKSKRAVEVGISIARFITHRR